MGSMCGGEIAVIDRRYRAPLNLFDVAAGADPIGAQRREAPFDVAVEIGIAPRTAGVVDANGLVDFDLAGDGFRGGERNFPERDAEVGMEFARDVDLAGVWQ